MYTCLKNWTNIIEKVNWKNIRHIQLFEPSVCACIHFKLTLSALPQQNVTLLGF